MIAFPTAVACAAVYDCVSASAERGPIIRPVYQRGLDIAKSGTTPTQHAWDID